MSKDFKRAHKFTATWEGGFVDHPSDPGGATNFGVTERVWKAWCASQGLPHKPIRAITMDDALPLYEARYWKPLAASLPWPLSAVIYDMSVNHGVGDGKPDGVNDGGATFLLAQARRRSPNGTPLQQARAAIDAREAFFNAIVANRPASKVFLRGWMNRLRAQREWLDDNAEPDDIPSVFLAQENGKRVQWDGENTVYAGKSLDTDLIERLLGLYKPGTEKAPHGGMLVTVWEDGAVLLERR